MHFFQKIFFVTAIDCSETIEAVTMGRSSKFSSVRSNGTDFIVEARNVACLCPSCCFGDSTVLLVALTVHIVVNGSNMTGKVES